MCRKVAAVIKSRFAAPPSICEQKYFMFPTHPDFANQEFGTASFKSKTKNENRGNVFIGLMKLMKASTGPLAGGDLAYLKAEIKKDPELLGMFSPSRAPWSNTNANDLCTLLHQAAAGPAQDAELVEWMIQLGALSTQPMHCRIEPREKDLPCPRKLLPNTMAIHSAVIAGNDAIVRLLLEADFMADVNSPTFHTKETLAHLAAKHDRRHLLRSLSAYGIDLRIRDAFGQRACDVAVDKVWSCEIAELMKKYDDSEVKNKSERYHIPAFRHQVTARAEKLHKSVFEQGQDEQERAVQPVNGNPRGGSKKKRKQKKRSKGKPCGNASQVTGFDSTTSSTSSNQKILLLDVHSSSWS